MSYARIGCDGSDVYVYHHCDGYYVCHWCSMHKDNHFTCHSPTTMIGHLAKHRQRGECVPSYVSEALMEEKDVNIEESAMEGCEIDRLNIQEKMLDPKIKLTLSAEIKGVIYALGCYTTFGDVTDALKTLSRSVEATINLNEGED